MFLVLDLSFANSLTRLFQEFKFNANAKSFVPFQPPRPISPIVDNSFYYPPMATATHMHGMPSGVGVSAHISISTAFYLGLDGLVYFYDRAYLSCQTHVV